MGKHSYIRFFLIWSLDESSRSFCCIQTCSVFTQHWLIRARSLWAFWYGKHLVLYSKSIYVNDTNTVENVMTSWWLLSAQENHSWRCSALFCGVTHMILLFPIWSETLRSSFWPLFLCQLLQPCLAVLWYVETTLQVEQMLFYLLGGNLLNKS